MAGNDVGVPDKMTVFQRCVSSFNSSGLSAEDARSLLTQLVHLFYVGDTFQEGEATQLFFTITKLFQKESAGLKQMIYLAIKELVPLTDNVIMGTSVLMRDVQQAHNSPESALYRPQALRALCRILDAGAVEGMDRLMRSAIVDKHASMASAALVSAYHLLGIARDSVRRWATEIQEACGSPTISQYHALGLLREVRQHDRMALLKLAVSLADQRILQDPNAQALHVRLVGDLLLDYASTNGGGSSGAAQQLRQILRGYLHNHSDIVALEAAKTALTIPIPPQYAQEDELVTGAINVLRAYLESPRATSRFAAIRALNRYAGVNPALVAGCNDEIEQLISDSNQAIATYAITALLKTGSEASVDTLIERIAGIMQDTADDFRLVVVDAVRNLAKRFPAKHDRMLDFFAETLQHHGHFELKLAIVEAISDVLHADSAADSLNNALMMLCETIEDSEYPEVTIRVLHLLGNAGPAASKPSTYVRFIYNRVILENSTVRAAAISALAKFADVVPGTRQLIKRSLQDPNDEVRDRAAVCFVADVSSLPDTKMLMADLESRLTAYLADPSALSKPFDASGVRLISDEERLQTRLVSEVAAAADEEAAASTTASSTPVSASTPRPGTATGGGASRIPSRGGSVDPSSGVGGGIVVDETEVYAPILAEISEIAAFGELLHTGPTQNLTDEDMEYVVAARVHVFAKHVVLQYEVRNNYELNVTDVSVDASLDAALAEQFTPKFVIPAPSLAPGESASVYIGIARGTDEDAEDVAAPLAIGYVSSTLQFAVDEDRDEYPIDDLEVRPADYIALPPASAMSASSAEFDALWSQPGLAEETATHQLKSCSNLREATTYLQKQLGMALSGGSSVPPESDVKANLLLQGRAAASQKDVLVKAQLVRSARSGVAGRFAVRSEDEDAAIVVADGI